MGEHFANSHMPDKSEEKKDAQVDKKTTPNEDDSETDGDAYKVTEEIEVSEPEEKIIIREERYVNEDGKTVVRRVYKKPKRKRKSVKRKKKTIVSPRKPASGGFAGIPADDEEDGTPELMRFKLKSTKKKSDETLNDDEGDDDKPEWQKKKLRSKDSQSGKTDTTVDEEVFNFRKLLKKRQDSPVVERRAKVKAEDAPNFLGVLKKSNRDPSVVDEKKTGTEEEKPNFLGVLKKRTPAQEAQQKTGAEEEKPNFLGVLKKTGGTKTEQVEKKEPEKEIPEWQRMRLKSSGKQGIIEQPQDKETATENVPFTSVLRKTADSEKVKQNIDEEERAAKARESELKAIERQKVRKQKEEAEKAARANEEKKLGESKATLQQEVAALQKEKEDLQAEIKLLRKKVKKYKSRVAQ